VRGALAALVAVAGLIAACDGGGVVSNPYQCIGLPISMCEEIVQEARQERPGVAVVGATIRCTVAVCTEQRGEAEVRIDYANGVQSLYGRGWEHAAPGGPAPVPRPVPVDPVPASAAPS
jgi:hypothetical protein